MKKSNKPPSEKELELPISKLRWQCVEEWLDFATTDEIEPVQGVVGQDDAVEALRFGLEINAPGQNIYVRGLTGTGRAALVEQLLTEINPPRPSSNDLCYAHNFAQPDSPLLLSVPRGSGLSLTRRMDDFVTFVEKRLGPQLEADTIRAKRWELDDKAQKSVRELGKPFEEELRANELALVPVQIDQVVQPTIMPLIDGKPVALNKVEEMVGQGSIDAARIEEMHRKISDFARRFDDVNQKISEIQLKHSDALSSLYENETRRLVEYQFKPIRKEFPGEDINAFLQSVVNDLVGDKLYLIGGEENFTRVYRINPILTHALDEDCPVTYETAPTLQNLVGNIDREFNSLGNFRSDHLMIRAGSLLRADGGFLVLEAREILSEPGAWKFLLRALKTGQLEMAPSELSYFFAGPMLKPQPIPIQVKVILIGDPGLYQLLDAYDPDFPFLFKVLSDFDTTIPRDEQGVRYYAGILARVARDEKLKPFDRSGIIAMTEHGARIAGENNKLTMRFGRLIDVVSSLPRASHTPWTSRMSATSMLSFIPMRGKLLRTQFSLAMHHT